MSKLKEKRMEVGLSQSQLANKAQLNVRVLQHYEQMTKKIDHARMDKIIKICLVLNCSIDEIIENDQYIELYQKYAKKNSLR